MRIAAGYEYVLPNSNQKSTFILGTGSRDLSIHYRTEKKQAVELCCVHLRAFPTGLTQTTKQERSMSGSRRSIVKEIQADTNERLARLYE